MEQDQFAETSSFSTLLAEAMKLKQLDYRTLAKLVGVSHAYLWQLATAEKRGLGTPSQRQKRPSRALALKLAETLELEPALVLRAAGLETADRLEDAGEPRGILKYSRFEPDAPALFQRGIEEAKRGNVERGLVLLKHVLGQDGVSFVRAHMGLGVAYLKARQFLNAVEEFNKAIAQFDTPHTAGAISDGITLADIYYNRGLAYQDLDRHRKANQDFRRAISLHGVHLDRYYAGLCFSELAVGHFARVIRAALEFTSAVQKTPVYTTAALDVRLYGAYALARRGDHGAALLLLDSTILMCPTYWYGYYVFSAAHSRLAEYLAKRSTTRRGHARMHHESLVEQLVTAGLQASLQALALNPECRSSFLTERNDDFAYFARRPEFAPIFGQEGQV